MIRLFTFSIYLVSCFGVTVSVIVHDNTFKWKFGTHLNEVYRNGIPDAGLPGIDPHEENLDKGGLSNPWFADNINGTIYNMKITSFDVTGLSDREVINATTFENHLFTSELVFVKYRNVVASLQFFMYSPNDRSVKNTTGVLRYTETNRVYIDYFKFNKSKDGKSFVFDSAYVYHPNELTAGPMKFAYPGQLEIIGLPPATEKHLMNSQFKEDMDRLMNVVMFTTDKSEENRLNVLKKYFHGYTGKF